MGGIRMRLRARSQVARWGSSLAIQIPEPVAEAWGVREGSETEMVLRGDELVTRKKAYDHSGSGLPFCRSSFRARGTPRPKRCAKPKWCMISATSGFR